MRGGTQNTARGYSCGLARSLGLAVLFSGGCSSSAALRDAAATAGSGGASAGQAGSTGEGGPRGSGGSSGGGAGGTASPSDAQADMASPSDAGADAGHDGPPQAADMIGSWNASFSVPDGGVAAAHRLRFDGDRYFLVRGLGAAYCAEAGTFDVANAVVSFRPDQMAGQGTCPTAVARQSTLSWTDNGIALVGMTDGGPAEPVNYVRARNVPKIFATVEGHNGNFAGDANLPGASVMEKVDLVCARSLARPDGQTYKALFSDGVNRLGIPARDWVLKPDTTYFQAEGVLNIFRTDATALAKTTTNHPVEMGVFAFIYYWSGLSFTFGADTNNCNGWTTASTTVYGRVSDPRAEGSTFTSSVVTGCDRMENGLICVSQ